MILSLFKPKSYVHSVYEINVEELVKQGIRLLLCDIDNTLVAYHEEIPPQKAIAWFQRCEKAGLQIILISNNKRARVAPFAQVGKLDYHAFSCKPFKGSYKRILKKMKMSTQEVACTGDQLLTDILGGNRMQIHTIFLDPLVDYDSAHTGFSRFFEKYILRYLSKRKQWNKGDYYGFKM